MLSDQRPDLPRQDAFRLLDELFAMGHFSSRADVREAMQTLQDHLSIGPSAAQALLIEWMKLQRRLFTRER